VRRIWLLSLGLLWVSETIVFLFRLMNAEVGIPLRFVWIYYCEHLRETSCS
jgi:hypothetical protein